MRSLDARVLWLALSAIPFVPLLCVGCDTRGLALTVRVQTGLRAEREVRYAEVAFLAGAHDCDDVARDFEGRAIALTDQAALAEGSFTVREIGGLAAGVYTVRARLRRPSATGGADSGAELVSRCVVVSIASDRVLRIPLTSDCLAVDCPAPMGSPAFDQCLNGHCVDPRCDPDDPATAAFCCDRTLLGDACDSDPTLCSASDACEATLACLGAPTCSEGVCVEPVEDLCDEDTFCATETATCEPLPGTSLDAGMIDAGTEGPDGSCSDGLDGDADGAIDCEDTDCSTEDECRNVICPVGTVRLDAGAAGLPVAPSGPMLWWRDDTNIVSRSFGICGWGDGIRGLVLRPSSRSRAPLITAAAGGGSAVVMGPGDLLTVFDAEALAPSQARTIVAVARHTSRGFNHALATSATNQPGIVTGLRHDDRTYAYEGSARVALAMGIFVPGFAREMLTMPDDHDASTAALYISGASRTLVDGMGAAVAHVPDRQSVGSPSSMGTVEVREILVYDRELDAADRALVDAYLTGRTVGS